jgi:endo-1,4-beta-xylanase
MRRVGEREIVGAVVLVAALAGCSSSNGVGGAGGAGGGGAALAGAGAQGGSTIDILSGTGGLAGAGKLTGSGGIAGSGGVTGASGVAGATGVAGGTSVAGAAGVGAVGGSAGLGGSGGRAGNGGGAGNSGKAGTGTFGGASGSAGNGGGGSVGSGGAGGASSTCLPSTSSTGGKRYCSNSKGNAGPGYGYEIWSSGQGSGCMTVYNVDANFSATWTEATDFLARAGLRFDQTKTPAQVGTISANFAEAKTESPVQGRTSKIYFAVYGWTLTPLVEYYIMEDYGAFVPGPVASDGTPRNHLGTVVADGGTYDLWQLHVTNKPAITGDNAEFDQVFSVRQTRRPCGHISVSEQFSQWAALGVQLGKLEETMFLMEAQNNSGTIDVTANLAVK